MNAAICKTTDNSTGAMPDKTKKIMVSDFTTFNSYFFDRKHGNMKRQIYNYLNHALESVVFSSLTGFEILTERITAKCCKLEKLRYRGIDRTSFYTDMDVHLLLDTPEKAFCWKGMRYSINNSGHFKPDTSTLIDVEADFEKVPSSLFHKDFQGYIPFS